MGLVDVLKSRSLLGLRVYGLGFRTFRCSPGEAHSGFGFRV